MMELYHAATSVCSQKVRIVAAEKGLRYTSRLIDLGKGEQHEPEYVRLNPEGVVPTLVHDGRVILESSVIAEYFDRLSPKNPLMPTALAAEFATRLWLLRTLAIHDAINTLTFSTNGRERALSQPPEVVEAAVARMPNPQMAAKRRDLYANGTASSHVGGALFALERTFREMTQALERSGGPWLYGAGYGLADAVLLAYVDRLERLGMEGIWQGRHPGIDRWLAASQARPSYADAIVAFVDAGAAAKMRASGATHWPAIAAQLT